MMRFPSGVSTDSGWNWMPRMSYSRWRSPAFGYHLQDGRERGFVYYPRVIPAYGNLVRKPSEEVILGIDGYRALDAVEDGGEVDELSSEHFADGLLAQADA